MRPVKWNRKLLVVIFVAILLYLTCFFKYYKYTSEGTIKNIQAKKLWDFIADFSNMKKLQPYLRDFHIISESGNYDHWKYHVKYFEPLSDWPYFDTISTAHYSVKTEGDRFVIFSEHETCYFGEHVCLKTQSDFVTYQVGNDARYKETIAYQCPPILGPMCTSQVNHSRTYFMKRLHKQFA